LIFFRDFVISLSLYCLHFNNIGSPSQYFPVFDFWKGRPAGLEKASNCKGFLIPEK
jgi:hypothetical protein